MSSQQYTDRGSFEWPAAFDRTPPEERRKYPGGFEVSQREAFESIVDELEAMDAYNFDIQTNAEHLARRPHVPYKNSDPDDPAVVVYFDRDGQGYAVPCDRWNNLRDNARSIAKYLDAKRAIERYGVSTVDTEMSTQALPPGDEEAIAAPPAPNDDVVEEEPHEILGVAPDAPEEIVTAAFKTQLKKLKGHPDTGGSSSRFKQLQNAREAMLDD